MMLFGRLVSIVLLAASLVSAPPALAQPGNPGPSIFTDLGDIDIGSDIVSPDVSIPAQTDQVWFRFSLRTAITPLHNWLELDTSGPATLTNPHMGLYDARSNRIATNDDSGGSAGAANNGNAAAMSFGGGSGRRISGTDTQWGGGCISLGWTEPTLDAGVYWVVIGPANVQFPDPNPNWDITSDSSATGTVRLRISMGRVAADTWNEEHHGIDSGQTPATAQVVLGSGPLRTILCTVAPRSRDMFRIRICDGDAFQVIATSTSGPGANYRTRLFLFDADGRGVAAIHNTSGSFETTLTRPDGSPPLVPGEYYLALSSRCPGATVSAITYASAPYAANDQPIWTFATTNASIAPDGPAAASPIAYWGRQTDCEGLYYVRLALTGACYVEDGSSSCPGDLNGDGSVGLSDLTLLLASFGTICP